MPSRLPLVPLGDPELDRFQQNVARALDSLERDIVASLRQRIGFAPIVSVSVGLAPVTFAGIDGNDSAGFSLHFRARASAANTVIGVRFNGDGGANYRHASARVDNTGAVATGTGSDAATAIALVDTVSFDAGAVLAGVVTIPISVIGENRYVTAETSIDGSGGVRGYWTRGRWSNTAAKIMQIQIVATAGSIDSFVGTLYRTVR